MVARAKTAFRMTVEEFLVWDSGDPYRYELVDGEPVMMAQTSNVHGLLQTVLGSLIHNHLRQMRPGCDVLSNPGVVPRLLSAGNFRVPDLGVTCAGVTPGPSVLPEPVLLIEILSPGNRTATWSNVWTYTSIPSVREIVVLHSQRIAAEVLRRDPGGEWPESPEQVTDGDLALDSVGFRTPLAALYERTGVAS